MYDRLNGSTTMIISSPGTTILGTPICPKYLIANVYLPPAFVAHHSDLHQPILDIVQKFIETIGVGTVYSWQQWVCSNLGYPLTQVGNPCQNAIFTAILHPACNSSHYTFLSQPSRIKDDPSDDPAQVSSPAHLNGADLHQGQPDTTKTIIVELVEANSNLQEQVNTLEQTTANLEEQVSVFTWHHSFEQRQDEEQIVALKAQVQGFFTYQGRGRNEVGHHPHAATTPLNALPIMPGEWDVIEWTSRLYEVAE